MLLSNVVPISRIEASLGQTLSVERIDSHDWRVLAKRDPVNCYGVAGRAWHLAVSEPGSSLDPSLLARYFDTQDPMLAGAIQRVTGKPVLTDFGFVEATVISHSGKPFIVATSLVAHLTAGELLWYDINMANPAAPLSPRERRSPSQEHRGFGLLGDVVSFLEAAARERGCTKISLMAAHKPLIQIFRRFGFQVENSPLSKLAMKVGMSIPMIKPVR
jgi:hypothetical protein